MGEIKGFVCLNCEYEETHYIGIGFRVRDEKLLYTCANCEALTSSNAKTPRCRKCRSRRLTEVKDDFPFTKCPKCNHTELKELAGCWD